MIAQRVPPRANQYGCRLQLEPGGNLAECVEHGVRWHWPDGMSRPRKCSYGKYKPRVTS